MSEDSGEDVLVAEGGQATKLDEGRHDVVVESIETRSTDHGPYLDVNLEVEDADDFDKTLTFGLPLTTPLTSNSYLGRLVEGIIGDEIVEGHSYDLRDIIEGAELEVYTVENSDGFAEVEKERAGEFAISAR